MLNMSLVKHSFTLCPGPRWGSSQTSSWLERGKLPSHFPPHLDLSFITYLKGVSARLGPRCLRLFGHLALSRAFWIHIGFLIHTSYSKMRRKMC